MKTAIIIPARYASSRFPGKPLAKILGKELILWVHSIAKKAVGNKHVYVATESKKILNFLKRQNIKCFMTSKKCMTGTDRIAEVAKKINYKIFINLQGDEPLVSHKDILKIIELKKKKFNEVICGYTKLNNLENPKNKNIPKVLFNERKKLIYISRNILPASKKKEDIEKINFYKQVCIYAFNKDELNKFSKYNKKSYPEKYEDIELLRFFELDVPIRMLKTCKSSLAVDIASDIKLIERHLKRN